MMSFDISASIVLFKNAPEVLTPAIDSFLNTNLRIKLYLVDNSPTDALRNISTDPRIEYIFTGSNLGFGKAHNIAMKRALEESSYHLVLNPDIYFEGGVLESLYAYMEAHPDTGQMMPKILYPDKTVQHLCKLLPSPVDLFLRRFFPWFPGAEARNRQYELTDSGYDKIMNIPYLSGCFMFLRTSVLKEIGLFDERIFMYIEDTDLTRRIHLRYKTLFYPEAVVYHHYSKGSYKSFKLMMYNVHGASVYFMKWGWFFDRQRREINKKVISTYLR
jgi:GT2 family glycosyltransferase